MTVGTTEHPVQEGSSLSVGGKEIEVERSVLRADYLSGSCFGRATALSPHVSLPIKTGLSKQFVPLTRKLHDNTSLRLSSGHEKKLIPLQPVDLFSANSQNVTKKDDVKVKAEDSHWTANWSVVRYLPSPCASQPFQAIAAA